MEHWPVVRREVEPGRASRHGALGPTLLALIRAEGLGGKAVLDVGTGSGRLALALADEAGRVVGIDVDARAIETARRLARERGLGHVTFVEADAERIDYRPLGPFDLVVANLCMSDPIIERAARTLPPGACLAFACFHTEQWRETGQASRFAYSPERLEAALRSAGFEPEHLEVEQEVIRFASAEEARRHLAGLRAKWEASGRWAAYEAYLAGGGRALTESRLIVKARRR